MYTVLSKADWHIVITLSMLDAIIKSFLSYRLFLFISRIMGKSLIKHCISRHHLSHLYSPFSHLIFFLM